jgi:hypothetical protein
MRQNMLGKWSFSTDGMLAGLFFNRTFEAGPFGGSQQEYEF